MSETETELKIAAEQHTIYATQWSNNHPPRAVIQLFHGLGEHRARYRRFAEVATAANMAVFIHDHRGHGADSNTLGFFAESNGWQTLIDDGLLVNDAIRTVFPDTPIFLVGHSMGSYVAQTFAMQHSARIGAMVLSASTWPQASQTIPGRIIAKLESWRLGRRGKSPLLHKLGFGNFNRPFEPARTELDWLSRDAAEVDTYINDPLCGGPYSCGLWLDLLGGLRIIAHDSALELIPSELPILLTGGEDDPVGGAAGIGLLARHYAQTGHHALSVRLYENGRHEMFNEINRDEFSRNLVGWLENQLPVVAKR